MTQPGPPVPRLASHAVRPHPNMAIRCSVADSPTAAAEHHRIRLEVFVTEQAIFTGDDIDDHDDEPTTIKVLGFCDQIPAGTVRLFPTSPDATQWQGDRLAVLAPYRHQRVGAPLVEFAVRMAAEHGGHRMTAHIQLPNVRFFEALGWSRSGAVENYVGLAHQPMAIDVRRRAAMREPATGDSVAPGPGVAHHSAMAADDSGTTEARA